MFDIRIGCAKTFFPNPITHSPLLFLITPPRPTNVKGPWKEASVWIIVQGWGWIGARWVGWTFYVPHGFIKSPNLGLSLGKNHGRRILFPLKDIEISGLPNFETNPRKLKRVVHWRPIWLDFANKLAFSQLVKFDCWKEAAGGRRAQTWTLVWDSFSMCWLFSKPKPHKEHRGESMILLWN